MVREPTESELNYINENLSKKKLNEEEVYVLDATIANNYMLTLFYYYLGVTSLANFVNDLANPNESQKFLINHSENVPLGTWLEGFMGKNSEGYVVEAPVYMVKGLEAGGYSTDDIIKAYHAGHLTDVSLYWQDGDPICDICDLDIRDSDCPHIPGQEYEGVIATCTIENAHLGGEISGVWKGALPGAKFKDKLSQKSKNKDVKDKPLNWEKVKKTGLSGTLSHMLTMPIKPKAEPKEENMTFEQAKAKFKDELAEEFIPKAEHDEAMGKISEKHNELVGKFDTLKGEKETVKTENGELTKKFADANVELEEKRPLADIGKVHIENLTKEYHRLGVALHEDDWDEEAKNVQLNAMNDNDKFTFLKAEIQLTSEAISKKLNLNQHSKNKNDNDEPYTHMNNDDLYKTCRL